MDYDKIFDIDIDKNFFYSNFPGKKMVDGKISLKNAIARLNKGEYYTFVTYNEGDILPKEYVPLNGYESEYGTLFATLNPNITYIDNICRNGGIQLISRLNDLEPGNVRYLLGPGPATISLNSMVKAQYENYIKTYESAVKKTR